MPSSIALQLNRSTDEIHRKARQEGISWRPWGRARGGRRIQFDISAKIFARLKALAAERRMTAPQTARWLVTATVIDRFLIDSVLQITPTVDEGENR